MGTASGGAARVALAEVVDRVRLGAPPGHGAQKIPRDRAGLERVITESDRGLAPGTSAFDSQVGFAIRRWCAPVLGLEPHAEPDTYVARRQELGPEEVNRRLLGSSGVSDYLIDTGFASDDLLGLDEIASVSGARAREIVRLESVAEQVATRGMGAAKFGAAFVERLQQRLARGAVGTKSVVAYRHGFGFDPERPTEAEVTAGAATWFAEIDSGARPRVRDPRVLRHLLWSAIDAGLPLQFHVGFGDSDVHLALANPALLTDFIKLAEPSGTPIMLLHCYPYHREAGYLAHIYPNVYFDVGVAVNYLGAQSPQLVAESLEVGPFGKQLFSSDAWGPAELHHLGAVLWRRAFTAVVGGWVASNDWTLADAGRVARMIAFENAERVYRLA
ncbi:MAG: amidohydrolase family protein [Actinomycetota bacterium]